MFEAEELREHLLATELATPEQVRPCSERDIADLEKAVGVTLPEAYKRFMRACGRGAGWFLDEVTAFYPALTRLTERVKEDLRVRAEDTGDPMLALPGKAFVFANYELDPFLYFVCDAGDDDPSVYAYEGGPGRVRRKWRSYTACLESMLAESVAYVRPGPPPPAPPWRRRGRGRPSPSPPPSGKPAGKGVTAGGGRVKGVPRRPGATKAPRRAGPAG